MPIFFSFRFDRYDESGARQQGLDARAAGPAAAGGEAGRSAPAEVATRTMTEQFDDSGNSRNTRPQGGRGAQLHVLTRRADFLAAAKGRRFHSHSFSLQATPRKKAAAPLGSEADEPAKNTPMAAPMDAACAPRFGLTVTKRLGGAVVRNRIRRRLREALRLATALPARPCHDYVIVARPAALEQSFSALQDELQRAIAGIHASGGTVPGKGKARSGPGQPQHFHK